MKESVKLHLKSALKPAKGVLTGIFETLCRISRLLCYAAHKILFHVHWSIPPSPDNFDHFIDIYYLWMRTRNPMFFERGVFSRLAIKDGAEILELSCGDGFMAKYFYSQKAKKIVAMDCDPDAVRKARKINCSHNIEYLLMNIKDGFPEGEYDNVIWDIVSPFSKYFTEEEMHFILAGIKRKTGKSGCFSGHTHTDDRDGGGGKIFLLRGKDDLSRLLKPYFANILVFETNYQERNNLYFWASDGEIPFSADWKAGINQSR